MGESEAESAGWRAAWRDLALALPRHHVAAERGDVAGFASAVAALAVPAAHAMAGLDAPAVMALALDAFMVEAFARRHAAHLEPATLERVGAAARAVADRAGMQPIISYPLYIRHNPMAAGDTRLFTPLAAEERFVRMHRFIEDRFDEVIATLEGVLAAPDVLAAYRAAHPAVGAAFARINRVMAGFRDQERMPRDVFTQGFRPYYESVLDPMTGDVVLDGPSGLQSPTFRVVAMLAGYRDAVLDDWTERIGRYHVEATRQWLANARVARDAGHALGAAVEAALGPDALPHIHPSYADHQPALVAIARRGGWLTADALDVLAAHGLAPTEWPVAGATVPDLPPAPPAVTDPATVALLTPLAELEAMLFGFHVEHVGVAATQIGAVRGTGGTSGVEFLLLALFRRAFPGLWARGIGALVAERA